MIVPGIDVDIPAEAVGVPLQSETVQPRQNSPEFESLDLRMNQADKDRAASKLAEIRARLFSKPETVQDSEETRIRDHHADLNRKRRLLDMLGGKGEETRQRVQAALYGNDKAAA